MGLFRMGAFRWIRWLLLPVIIFNLSCSGMGRHEDAVDVQLVSLGKSPPGVQDQTFTLLLRMTNLTDKPLDFKGIVCDLELEGYRLVRGVQGAIRPLEPYSSVDVEVKASISLMNSLRLFNALATQNKNEFTYRLRTRLDPTSFWQRSRHLEQSGSIKLGL